MKNYLIVYYIQKDDSPHREDEKEVFVQSVYKSEAIEKFILSINKKSEIQNMKFWIREVDSIK